jgi:uncharacterized iron-regulated membrane protein
MDSTAILHPDQEQSRRVYRVVWRWHFYAGVFCIPLVIWLACTGSIYLFKPQIERWLDQPYDHLGLRGQRATPEQIANAGMDAVPRSSLHYYEVPQTKNAAVRVIVGIGQQEYRVYVHPETLRILKIADEDRRPMRIIFRLHGELQAGDWGSRVVELAASWAIVLIVSGSYLWWPRQANNFAGVLWVRLRKGKRIFWRDLHAVTGIWISTFAVFLLVTGLPWAKSWGAYFNEIRRIAGTTVTKQDWTTGRSSEFAEREALNRPVISMDGGGHAEHTGHVMYRMSWPNAYEPLNRIVPAAEALHLSEPVLIMPAMRIDGAWTVKSDSQNRPHRTTVMMDSHTARVLSREDFSERHWIDRIVGIGVAAHEGQLFGLANQLLGLATAIGLVLLSVSALILWWRRRNTGVLGAPLPLERPRWPLGIAAVIVALALYLPAMAASLLVVILLEKFLLSRIPSISRWLGLSGV